MKNVRSTFLFSLLCLASAVGCDKPSGGAIAEPATSVSTKPSAAPVVATASASAASVASLTVTGSYDSKVAEVRTPKDAPKFKNEETKALGAGTLSLTLPATTGVVVGTASGSLGAQRFSGILEDGQLNGTLSPADAGTSAFTGKLVATITGEGSARVVAGTVRASDGSGAVVREAAFTLKSANR